jgi:hypothetical protein
MKFPLSHRSFAAACVAVISVSGACLATPALAGNVPVPSTGLYLGAALDVSPRETGMKALDTATGAKHVLSRSYYNWDSIVNSSGVLHSDIRDAIAASRTPHVSVKPKHADGSMIKFAAISAGTYDADIKRMANALKATGKPIMVTFMHEPESEVADGYGTIADYKAAYRHFVTVMRGTGATNLSYVPVFTGWTFDNGKIKDYYPGDDVVDWISIDGYSWNYCAGQNQGWKSFSTIIKTSSDFAKLHNKPLVVAEYGVNATTTADIQKKADWYINARSEVKNFPQVKALELYNVDNHSGTGCYWQVETHSNVLSAYHAMATDSYFTKNPLSTTTTTPPPTGSDTTKPTLKITAPVGGSSVGASATVTATASDNVGVASVSVSADGTAVGSDSSSPYSIAWNTSKLLPGTHTLTATAKDAAGNSASTSVTVTVTDTTAPTVKITSPAPGAKIKAGFTYAATATDAQSGIDNSVSFRINGVWFASDATAPYSVWVPFSKLVAGANELEVRAMDNAHNSGNAKITVYR